ncbi:putative zinc ribbon domain protein [Microbacterium laevaniformans]|uniref:Putative zinc ribbon domain protein n=1 Tax=Microbacterium laevaniformans TaxID=36807 RepID=A0A150HDG6_9MICO|nr:C4-type zinc ribbon domain-containing protein [Microbacterium laevaniformans]KXZ60131.1 putative zinc ribbon domain protein [Microbacterium laevaniformans]
MKSRPADQQLLLELASLDGVISAAERARRSPEQARRVQELLARRQSMSAELTTLLGQRDDITAELARVESDVAVVDARAARDTERLASSANAKEAQSLEHELASLAKRKSDLEDAEIELMERLETAQSAVAVQEEAISAVNEEGARLSAAAKEAVTAATARAEAASRDRAVVAARVPADLLAMYDRLAARGVGAGLLHRKTCEACRMVLSGTDLQTIRQASSDDVVTCPECGAILVRTDESGL